ncbi:hypothetical protein H5232_01790 [Pseudoalteromonas sp. SG41-5]|uniref:GIY-YIG nuclease family protein n=1 Tax=Pseudoalteromonas sp. SG41-5 TaxID=2760975 RepID=UPI0016048F77|nr:GIY-YIG nuclease family protein [Pseudoalteromonas sp. SG41-5]MBB1467198.1 hypothetical protein [Pseudoalteromonas sp. SG41-5]
MNNESQLDKIIYAVRSVNLDKIKIGESKVHSLFNRIRSHQTGSADELELIGVHYGEFKTDKKIHPILNASHSHLEWFHNTEEVDDFINSNFLVFPKALSLLSEISWSTSETISAETIAIDEYVKGNISNTEFKLWLNDFDMLQYIKSALNKN